jgi:hypothetical protein
MNLRNPIAKYRNPVILEPPATAEVTRRPWSCVQVPMLEKKPESERGLAEAL